MSSASAPVDGRSFSTTAARPVRLLFVITSSDIGGTETMLRELAVRLRRSDFDPVVCSLCPPGRIGAEIRAAGVPVVSLEMSQRSRPFALARAVGRLAHLIDERRIELVHSFLYRANVLTRIAVRLSRHRPVVVSAQRSLTPLTGRSAALAARWTQTLSDQIVAVSEAVRQELIESDGVPDSRIVVIGNGVDMQRYAVTADGRLRAQLGCAAGSVLIGAVGRLSPEKGFRDLLESVGLLRARGVPVHLVLAGDGPERGRLELDAQAPELEDHVTFLGARRDVHAIYPALDIFALPSLEEGSPNALLEAMACGRAAVATRVGGVPEIIDHEQNGLIVDPGAPRAFAEALARLAADPTLRARLGTEARRRIAEQYDIAQVIERHAQLYRDLLERRQAA